MGLLAITHKSLHIVKNVTLQYDKCLFFVITSDELVQREHTLMLREENKYSIFNGV